MASTFPTHCIEFGVKDHLEEPNEKSLHTSNNTKCIYINSIVKLLIYRTISQPMMHMILRKVQQLHKYGRISRHSFMVKKKKKDAKAIQLHNELHNILIGD